MADPWVWAGAGALGAGAAGALGLNWLLRSRGLHRWIVPYVRSAGRRRAPRPGEPVHLILAVCDHYEPKRDNAPMGVARARVRQWVEEYPKLFSRFRDADGYPPQHTFFYPAEEYEPELLDMIGGLCRHPDGNRYGEVEVHLHHDNDTSDNLRRTLTDFKETLSKRHGMLSRDTETGEVGYAFIHGNWALDNSRSDGRWCGVTDELDVLRETGCFADFTLPSAPNETQTRKINSIYWAVDDPHKAKSHDSGYDLGEKVRPARSLLMVQGPLLLDWTKRKFGLLPGVENANLQKTQPPDAARLELWLRACVKVRTRPDWYFVKLHTHGAAEPNQDVLLGEPMVRFHEALRARADRDPSFRFSYVTAREMANLALFADQAGPGSEAPTRAARSFRYAAPG
jgi:hypothetical protein